MSESFVRDEDSLSEEQDKVRAEMGACYAENEKAEDFSSAFSGLYPPPGTLPNHDYCKGLIVVSQLVSAVVGFTRTTASAKEQK